MMRNVLVILILIVISCLWFFHYQTSLGKYKSFKNGQQIRVKGGITNTPYQKGSKQIIGVGPFSARVELYPKYFYGDQVAITGRLGTSLTDYSKPRLFLINPSIEEVSLGKEYKQQAIVNLVRSLFVLRQKLMQQFNLFLPEPHSSLLGGILLGVKRDLPRQFGEALRNTGTLHVVVASGYNVTVVAGVIAVIAIRFLSRRWAIPMIVVGIGAYTLMAGADPPVVRAAIMGGLSFIAQLLGKQYHGMWALFLAGVVMLFISPLLVFDVGFQLSIAATLGILLLSPVLVLRMKRVFRWLGFAVVEELGVTLGAQLAVLPILLVSFKQVSWLSPLVNLIVGFVVPIIMGMGGVLAIIAFVWEALAQLFALFLWVPLAFFIGVVSWFDRLPFGTFKVSDLSWWWVMGYYFVWGWVIFWVSRREKTKFLSTINVQGR